MFCLLDQFIFFFSSAHWHALQTPFLSNEILGLVEVLRQLLHLNIYTTVHPPSTKNDVPVM